MAFAPTLTPINTAVTAGPWTLTVTDAVFAADALAVLQAWAPGNEDAPAGLIWAMMRIQATNTGTIPAAINTTDFAAAGPDGVLRRPPQVDTPDDTLQAVVAPGDTAEGWVPLQINAADNVILRFNSPFLGGSWADAWFAVTDGAALLSAPLVPADASTGARPDNPAGINQTVQSGSFNVRVLDHLADADVYNIAGFGLQALVDGPAGATGWHAFRLSIANISDRPAFFSYTALRLTDRDGEPWDHLMQLGEVLPDAAVELLPGATWEGWQAMALQPWADLSLLRIMPSVIENQPRYIVPGQVTAADPLPTPSGSFAEGDAVVLTAGPINLRQKPSLTGAIVTELAEGSELTITGPAVEADGISWYPVTVTATGEAGFIAGNYLAAP